MIYTSKPQRRWPNLAAAFVLLAGAVFFAPTQAENAGTLPADDELPFITQRIAVFDTPWAMAFLPDGRLVVTERQGRMFLATQQGKVQAIEGVPDVYAHGQTGLHDVALSPHFAQDQTLYFTYVEPAFQGGSLVLARARLAEDGPAPQLQQPEILWRQKPAGRKGHPGARIAFAPDGQHLFLTVGERQESDTAQDPTLARGKLLRMGLDGSVPADNPWAHQDGVPALTWTTGHRNPYGLAFAPNGDLWLHEMGPRGGDELNRIERGANYGWPVVSNGSHYSGVPIPDHGTRPEFHPPALHWTPVIAPAGMLFYQGDQFPNWRGSALIGGLMSQGLVRVIVDDDGHAEQVNRWTLGARIRDVAEAPDGALWVIEDSPKGGLLRLTPK